MAFTDFGRPYPTHLWHVSPTLTTVTVLQSQRVTPACSSQDFTCLRLSRHILFTPAGHPRTFCVHQLQLVPILWGLLCFLAVVCNILSCLISICAQMYLENPTWWATDAHISLLYHVCKPQGRWKTWQNKGHLSTRCFPLALNKTGSVGPLITLYNI